MMANGGKISLFQFFLVSEILKGNVCMLHGPKEDILFPVL